jgi:HEAT repeat protein
MDKRLLNKQIILEYVCMPFYILLTIVLPCLFDSTVKLIDLVRLYIFPEQHTQKITRLIQVITNEPLSSGNRLSASQALGRMGGATRAIPQLIILLNHSNPEVRAYAVKALRYMRNSARGTVPQVLNLLKDPDPKVRHSSVEALGEIGELTQLEIPCLFPLLQDSDLMVRITAINILGYQEEFASSIVPQLIPLLIVKKDDLNTRLYAHLALQRLGYGETAL